MSAKCKRMMVYAGNILILIEGILLCLTLIGIPLAVFNFISYNRIKSITDLPDEEAIVKIDNAENFGWSIYDLIVLFPLGLLVFLPFVIPTSKNN